MFYRRNSGATSLNYCIESIIRNDDSYWSHVILSGSCSKLLHQPALRVYRAKHNDDISARHHAWSTAHSSVSSHRRVAISPIC